MQRYQWATRGDVNAFCGLVLDNCAGLILMVALLSGTYGLDANFSLRYMVPGTAIGVLVGDLLFTVMAFRLARRTGRNDITAMPLGLDTPSTFGMIFFVLGPAFLAARDEKGLDHDTAATYAWQIGVCAIITSGVFKIACAFAAGGIRRMVPRAGLLGSLAAIALVLISFMPMLDVAALPVVGYISLAIILTALVARVPVPGRIPGALAALAVSMGIYYLMQWTGTLGMPSHAEAELGFTPQLSFLIPWPRFEWVHVFADSLYYLPVVIPFALATVIGGIDCTESAAAVGDEYHTGHVVGAEAVATLCAGLCGGVIQTTPYIGHPAYKAMGGRAAYTLATALFIGGAGIFGYFAFLYSFIPKAAIMPILIFIGLEITAQSYHATPKRHYAAVALACIPALAYLVAMFMDNLLTITGAKLEELGTLGTQLVTMRILSAGFILTSLLWGAMLAALIDRRFRAAAAFAGVLAVASLFGVIHSPLPGARMLLPWDLPELPAAALTQTPLHIAAAYAGIALVFIGWGAIARWQQPDTLAEQAADEAHVSA